MPFKYWSLNQMDSPDNIYQSLEYIYDRYSPVIYGIALQISSSAKEAQQILVATFQKIHKLKLYQQNNPCPGVLFIKLAIETACEQFPKYKRSGLQLKQFQKSPILNRLLCENISTESFSRHNNLTRSQSMKDLRAELSLLLKAKKEYLVRIITIPADINETSLFKSSPYDYRIGGYCV